MRAGSQILQQMLPEEACTAWWFRNMHCVACAACGVHVLQTVMVLGTAFRQADACGLASPSLEDSSGGREDTKRQALPAMVCACSASRVSPSASQLDGQCRGLQSALAQAQRALALLQKQRT